MADVTFRIQNLEAAVFQLQEELKHMQKMVLNRDSKEGTTMEDTAIINSEIERVKSPLRMHPGKPAEKSTSNRIRTAI